MEQMKQKDNQSYQFGSKFSLPRIPLRTLVPEVFSLSGAPKAFGFASPLVRAFGVPESEKTSGTRVTFAKPLPW